MEMWCLLGTIRVDAQYECNVLYMSVVAVCFAHFRMMTSPRSVNNRRLLTIELRRSALVYSASHSTRTCNVHNERHNCWPHSWVFRESQPHIKVALYQQNVSLIRTYCRSASRNNGMISTISSSSRGLFPRYLCTCRVHKHTATAAYENPLAFAHRNRRCDLILCAKAESACSAGCCTSSGGLCTRSSSREARFRPATFSFPATRTSTTLAFAPLISLTATTARTNLRYSLVLYFTVKILYFLKHKNWLQKVDTLRFN